MKKKFQNIIVSRVLRPQYCMIRTLSSAVNRFRTDANRDCANTPITSAYKSAKICTLAAFGLD